MKKPILVIGLLLFVSSAQAAFSKVDGKWVGACEKVQGQAGVDSYVFSGKDFVNQFTGYSDSECTRLRMVAKVFGTFQEGGESMHVKGAYHLDSTVSRVEMVFQDGGIIPMVNMVRLCGFSDWKKGVAKDVTGRKCHGQQMPTAGARHYDIVQADAEKLLSGKHTAELDGTSAEKCPQELDTARVYLKQ
jgi:hypothetical protein